MSPADTGRVLAKIQAYDRRTVGHTDVAAWHEAIGDLALDEALAAVAAWYREHREWVMPADIRDLTRGRRDTATRHPSSRPARDVLAEIDATHDAELNRRGTTAARAAIAAALADRTPAEEAS